MTTDRFTLAVAQPRVADGPDASRNVDHAVELVAQAAVRGARPVVFPEHYPGPSREGQDYDAAPAMTNAARGNGIAVCWSRMELCDDGWWRLVVYVQDRTGAQLLRYERTHPATVPPQDTGGWVAPGAALGSFELDGIPMGVVVCSELWIPETARVLALRGAQVLLSPAGGNFTSLTSNWAAIARARAIENQCYVAVTNNLYGAEAGAAMVAGPEHVLAAAGHAELIVTELDLARVRWLRTHDDALVSVKPFDAIPGLIRARRPELYGELAVPQADAFDYTTPPATPVVLAAGAGTEGAGA
jgi:predicted amidohydrolase